MTGVSDSLARAAHFRQAILQKAFEGKLVPQDPNNEPASVLLDRIRATRAQTPARRAPRKREVHA
jgi:type I restriction enzyme S subunit